MELADAGSFFIEWSGQRVATEHCLAKAIMRFWHSGFSVASGGGSWPEHVSAIKVASPLNNLISKELFKIDVVTRNFTRFPSWLSSRFNWLWRRHYHDDFSAAITTDCAKCWCGWHDHGG